MMRIRLRTLLVLVAVIAVGLAVGLTAVRHAPRRAYYLKQAAEETLQEREAKIREQECLTHVYEWTATVEKLERWSKETDFVFDDDLRSDWSRQIAGERAREADNARQAAAHAQRKKGYERAALYPWVQPPTDPPRLDFDPSWATIDPP